MQDSPIPCPVKGCGQPTRLAFPGRSKAYLNCTRGHVTPKPPMKVK